MPSTTQEEFNTVGQSGSGTTWSNLHKLDYPETGTATNSMDGDDTETNLVNFSLHEGIDAIPTGATFDSMQFECSFKKDGVLASAADVTFYGKHNFESNSIWSEATAATSVWKTKTVSGGRIFWKLTIFSPSEIIDKLQDGSLKLQVWAEEANGIPVDLSLKEVTLTVTYTSVEGKRGAILISC